MADDRDRVALRLPPAMARRLRLVAALRGRSANDVLTELCGRELPTEDELAAQLRTGGTDDQR